MDQEYDKGVLKISSFFTKNMTYCRHFEDIKFLFYFCKVYNAGKEWITNGVLKVMRERHLVQSQHLHKRTLDISLVLVRISHESKYLHKVADKHLS